MNEGRKTQALRSPVGGIYTPPTSVAASNPCLNCGTNIQLEYCPECGQRAIDSDPTLREFLHEAASETLNWDGKLFATLRLLVTKPGALTKEYLDGRRVRYISPLRLYLWCSVIFFFIAAMLPQKRAVENSRRTRTQIGLISILEADTASTLAELDSMSRRGNFVMRVWGSHYARAIRHNSVLNESVAASVPRATFVLLPVFAALFAFFFRDRRRHYPQHLVFAMHVHAVLFLALIGLLAVRFTTIMSVRLGIEALVGGGIGAYTLLAAHRVYGGSSVSVLARLLGVTVTYFAAFAAAMIAMFAIIVLMT